MRAIFYLFFGVAGATIPDCHRRSLEIYGLFVIRPELRRTPGIRAIVAPCTINPAMSGYFYLMRVVNGLDTVFFEIGHCIFYEKASRKKGMLCFSKISGICQPENQRATGLLSPLELSG
jgi:hypothetical protein